MNATGAIPNKIPIICEHDSWLSLDPLFGCPSRCDYCYLNNLQATNFTEPVERVSPKQLAEDLLAWIAQRGVPTWGGSVSPPLPLPFCIGNYTDQLMTLTGIKSLCEYLPLHRLNFTDHPLCVVTKAKLRRDDIKELDREGQRLLIFLSQSFASEAGFGRPIERGPTSRPADTVKNASLIADTNNLVPLHFCAR